VNHETESIKRNAGLSKQPDGFDGTNLTRRVISSSLARLRDYRKLRRQVSELKQATACCRDLGDTFDEVQRFDVFRSDQIRMEFLQFLDLLRKQPPRFLLEIGSRRGGTLFQMARICTPDATIISIDLELTWVRAKLHQHLGSSNQRIVCVRGNSRSPLTIARVKSELKGNQLDCLFIDGDHSLSGVTADFVNYAPLVRPGGIIAFHDIVPDHKSRYGFETENYTGGVPHYWQEIRAEHHGIVNEFVEDPNQDGFGIGLIRV
jgi:predicted O-methyltransferase YrrM